MTHSPEMFIGQKDMESMKWIWGRAIFGLVPTDLYRVFQCQLYSQITGNLIYLYTDPSCLFGLLAKGGDDFDAILRSPQRQVPLRKFHHQ
jgi:hypothetical protein